MTFDFNKAKQNAKKDLTNDCLGVLILGAGGDGKSTLCGSFGVRTLFLYSQGESHGILSASTMGTDIDAIRIDLDDEGNKLSPDGTYDRLCAILSARDSIHASGYQAIVVDSLSDLEGTIRATNKFKALCATEKGGHNSFAEGSAVITMLRPVFSKLKDLQLDLGIHFAVTCALDVTAREDNGELSEAKPKLSTYSVAEAVVLQFADIITVGRMINKEGKTANRIQFGSNISKESKNRDGTIKKLLGFTPRLAGVVDLPGHMAADLAKLIELKRKGMQK